MVDTEKINIFILALIGLLLVPIVYALVAKSIQHSGVVGGSNLEVYQVGTQTPLTAIDWGLALNGDTRQFDIKNTGTIALILSMTTDELYDWLDISFDQEGKTLGTGSTVTATFTLILTAAIPGTPFSFNTQIQGN